MEGQRDREEKKKKKTGDFELCDKDKAGSTSID